MTDQRGHDDASDPFHMHGQLALRFLYGDVRVGEEPIGILNWKAPSMETCDAHYKRTGHMYRTAVRLDPTVSPSGMTATCTECAEVVALEPHTSTKPCPVCGRADA